MALQAGTVVEELADDRGRLMDLVKKAMRPGEQLADYIDRTDEELRKQIKAALTVEITKLWTMVNRPVDKAQLMFYVNEFDGYPPERMQAAVGYLLRTRKYTNLPTIAEIYAALKETANADERKLNGRGRRALETASTWKKIEKRLKNADSSL